MDIGIATLISAGGVLVSLGVTYGVLRATTQQLTDSVKEIKSDLKETKADVKALGDKTADNDKNLALIAQRLDLAPVKKVANGR